MKLYSGYCPLQEKKCTIGVEQINAGTFDDGKPVYINGRIDCDYASYHMECDPVKCPILKENNVKFI